MSVSNFPAAFAESAARARRAVVSPLGYEAGFHYVDEDDDGFPATIPVMPPTVAPLADALQAMDHENERSAMGLVVWLFGGLVVIAGIALSWAAYAKFFVAA
jgi:hypothetical protein